MSAPEVRHAFPAVDAVNTPQPLPQTLRKCLVRSNAICEQKKLAACFERSAWMLRSANENARLLLAIESAQKALTGRSNVFDEVTYTGVNFAIHQTH